MPHSTANDREIAEAIAKLLNHFGTVDEPLAVRRAIAQDWLDDLREFGADRVRQACEEWRRAQTMRPTIADIRRLAIHAQHQDAERAAIDDQRQGELDNDTLRMWASAEYHGDFRSPAQRRDAAIQAQEERYARAAAYREGHLDEYDASHHPERLRERQAQKPNECLTATELGITAAEHEAAE